MRLIVLAVVAMVLSGCVTTKVVTQYNTIVIDIPPALLNCPQIGSIPSADTLTNQQVADFILKAYKYNKVCHLNMEKIKQFIDETKKVIK
jgi:hypothetical protein